MLAMALLGGLALTRIGLSHFPDVDRPVIMVYAQWPGAAPQAIEHDVCEIIEESLVQAEGVASIESMVRSGSVNITMRLQPGRNVDAALQDAQNRVGRMVGRLPKDLLPISLSKYNPEDMPIVLLALKGPYSLQRLSETASTTITDALQTVPGVGTISNYGPQNRTIKLWFNRTRLAERGLTISDAINGLRANNLEAPGGIIEGAGGDLSVRVLAQPRQVQDLAAIPITTSSVPGGGVAVVRLGDLATIEDGFLNTRRISMVDGQLRQGLGIGKQRGFSTIAVATAVRATVARLESQLPQGMILEVTQDSSTWINESLSAMWHELAMAVLLTSIVCWYFLGSFAAASTVLLAIPIALLGTVAALWGWGATLNTFTLLGLSLAIGLVVDDAIMVQESIDHHRHRGLNPRDAALCGTNAVRFAAMAATIAVLAVFAPVMFMRGEIGASFLQFGIALCVAVALSYVEAVTLAPARAAQFMQAGAQSKEPRIWRHLERIYSTVLDRVLRRPWLTLVGAALATVMGAWILLTLPGEISPDQDSGMLNVSWNAQATADQATVEALVDRISTHIRAIPGVARVQVSGDIASGGCVITLAPRSERRLQVDIMQDVRRSLATIPGLTAQVRPSVQTLIQVPNAAAADVSIRGPEHARCAEIADAIMRRWRDDSRLVDVNSSWRVAAAELTITPDRAACADLGVNLDDLAATVNSLIGGSVVGYFTLDGRRQDVRVRLRADQRSTPEDLGRLEVRTRAGGTIPLSALAHIAVSPAPAQLTRLDREPAVTIRANAVPGVSQDAAQRAAVALIGDLPPGYRAVPGDSAAALSMALHDLTFALVVGLIAAYLILVIQFNSLLHPLTVLTALPLAIVGAAVALYLCGQTMNLYSGLGMLLLMGLAKKNSILLVDRANQMREAGEATDPSQAMRLAGPARLRAILMTSIATCAAAVPIACGLGEGAEVRRPMAIAILGGISISTLLSLVVVPAFYVVTDRLQRRTDGGNKP